MIYNFYKNISRDGLLFLQRASHCLSQQPSETIQLRSPPTANRNRTRHEKLVNDIDYKPQVQTTSLLSQQCAVLSSSSVPSVFGSPQVSPCSHLHFDASLLQGPCTPPNKILRIVGYEKELI